MEFNAFLLLCCTRLRDFGFKHQGHEAHLESLYIKITQPFTTLTWKNQTFLFHFLMILVPKIQTYNLLS